MSKIVENIISERIVKSESVAGGDIGLSAKVTAESGRVLFVKQYSVSGVSTAEYNGLIELKKAAAVETPEVVAVTDKIIVLNFIHSVPKSDKFAEHFGEQLANLHKFSSEKYGFYEDNFIGRTPQVNGESENWSNFFIEKRLDFQMELAEKRGLISYEMRKSYEKFRERACQLLSENNEPPALLHGDLWSGNLFTSESGEPLLIDPAVYYGSREAEFGMIRLFGYQPQEFYDAYNSVYPLDSDWLYRVDIYVFYHILNHLNIFGSAYSARALDIMKKYCR